MLTLIVLAPALISATRPPASNPPRTAYAFWSANAATSATAGTQPACATAAAYSATVVFFAATSSTAIPDRRSESPAVVDHLVIQVDVAQVERDVPFGLPGDRTGELRRAHPRQGDLASDDGPAGQRQRHFPAADAGRRQQRADRVRHRGSVGDGAFDDALRGQRPHPAVAAVPRRPGCVNSTALTALEPTSMPTSGAGCRRRPPKEGRLKEKCLNPGHAKPNSKHRAVTGSDPPAGRPGGRPRRPILDTDSRSSVAFPAVPTTLVYHVSTYAPSRKEIVARWHVIDADSKVLGRIATVAARLLQGKHHPRYAPYLDTGDHVVIVNAARVRMTGRKETRKLYRAHSGYLGGLRSERAGTVRRNHPERLVESAVRGMLRRPGSARRCTAS